MSNKWSFVFNVLGLSIYNHDADDDWIYRIHRGIKSTLYSQIKFSSIISLVNHHCLHSNLIPFGWSSKKVIYLVWCSFLLCVCVCVWRKTAFEICDIIYMTKGIRSYYKYELWLSGDSKLASNVLPQIINWMQLTIDWWGEWIRLICLFSWINCRAIPRWPLIEICFLGMELSETCRKKISLKPSWEWKSKHFNSNCNQLNLFNSKTVSCCCYLLIENAFVVSI